MQFFNYRSLHDGKYACVHARVGVSPEGMMSCHNTRVFRYYMKWKVSKGTFCNQGQVCGEGWVRKNRPRRVSLSLSVTSIGIVEQRRIFSRAQIHDFDCTSSHFEWTARHVVHAHVGRTVRLLSSNRFLESWKTFWLGCRLLTLAD